MMGRASARIDFGRSAAQNCPTGKSLLIYRKRVKPQNQKYFAFPEEQLVAYLSPSRPTQRGVGRRHDEGRVAVDAEAATDERGRSVRRRRVVLTSRCWRQVLERLTLLGGDGGKRAVLRGDRVISRKAIAQGMSDALRCPVCSCAHFLCTLRMRPRVQRAPGIPCALFTFEGKEISGKARAQHVARTRNCSHRHCEERLRRLVRRSLGEGGSNPYFLSRTMDCFAEPVIGRAFARPVGSQ
jgi:hypothetical protein